MNDNDKHRIMCVDDEENILNALKRLLRKEGYELLTANSGEEGFKILKSNNIHLVICDQRMASMSGTDFLAQVKEEYPDIIRVILTGYTDVDSITESVNKGHIYKFLLKPWNDQNLKLEIRQCLEQYDLVQTNKKLQEMVLQQNEELKTVNENLEMLVEERTKDLEIQNQALELSRAILEDLPIPVIGVSVEKMIVLLNNKAQNLSNENKRFEIGKDLSDYFSDDLQNRIINVITADTGTTIEGCRFSGKSYNIDLMPVSGRFKGKGVVLAFMPNQHP